jgi:hypothetical protein
VREIVREKVLQPHRIIFCPSCRVLRAEAVDSNNTENDEILGHHRRRTYILDDWILGLPRVVIGQQFF